MKNLNTEISDQAKKALDRYATESGMKKQKIVELALIAYIKVMEDKNENV